MWHEAEQDVVNLTEPLKYGDMLCFTRGTFDRMAKEKVELEADRDRLKAALEEADAIIAWNGNDWTAPPEEDDLRSEHQKRISHAMKMWWKRRKAALSAPSWE